jgi:hypothetical protein
VHDFLPFVRKGEFLVSVAGKPKLILYALHAKAYACLQATTDYGNSSSRGPLIILILVSFVKLGARASSIWFFAISHSGYRATICRVDRECYGLCLQSALLQVQWEVKFQ